MMKFSDFADCKGYLEIYKAYPDGETTCVYADHNVICSGMGVTLAELFNASAGSTIADYKIDLFQVGVYLRERFPDKIEEKLDVIVEAIKKNNNTWSYVDDRKKHIFD